MKKIFLTFIETRNGKHHAHAETIKTGENLKNFIDRYPDAEVIHICENAPQAYTLAAEWNECYRRKGTNLY